MSKLTIKLTFKSSILILVVCLEIILINFLILKIQHESNHISVSPISSNSVFFSKNVQFKYFYEPKPNSIEYVDPQLIKNLGYPAGTIIRYKINADGLNQIPNYSIQKTKRVYRIVILGDSFTFGQNVNTEDNYPSKLNNLLNERLKCENINSFQVLNLGMEGYDIAYSVERYKLKGQKYNPDLVLWFIIDADLLRIDELQIPKTASYDAALKASGEETKLEKQGIFYTGWHMALNDIYNQLGGESKILDMQKQYFIQLDNYYKGPLLIFDFTPSSKQYSDELNSFKNSRKNTLLYDNLPNIYTDPQNYLKDYHPSPAGHTMIANALFDYLTQNNIIPCQKP